MATTGLKTPTEACAPSPVIRVSIIGNKMFICFTMLSIACPVEIETFDTIPTIKIATDKKHTKPIKSLVDFSLNLLLKCP